MTPAPRRAEVLFASGDILGEAATWSVREQALYWVDIRAPALHRLDPARSQHRQWPMPDLCCGVVLGGCGVILAFPRGLASFDPATAASSPLVEIEPAALGNRLNEAKCDRAGRLWVGSMRDFGAAATGSLYRVGVDLCSDRMLTGISVPNSLGWSPDGRTMYFADTPTGLLLAYDFDPRGGELGAARPLLPADALPGRPDGCAVDAEGHVWSARYGGGCVARISPSGAVSAVVRVGASQVTSCALGGRDLRTLYVTTAKQRLDPAQRRAQPDAGHVFAIEVEIPGLPECPFGRAVRP